MIIVLADDLSGAAEIGGIASRYGLDSVVQLEPNLSSNADVVVIDTATRAMKEARAVEEMIRLGDLLKNQDRHLTLFKKIDSAMRGHLVPEINALESQIGFNSILMLAANPEKGRKIISGQYQIDEVPIDQTIFKSDPDFPAKSADIKERFKTNRSLLPHRHITPEQPLLPGFFYTGDVKQKKDLEQYLSRTTITDLVCGAAECFEAFLGHLGYTPQYDINMLDNPSFQQPPFTLIVNGSTVQLSEEPDTFRKLSVPQFKIPGAWEDNTFKIKKNIKSKWHNDIAKALKKRHVASVRIGQPVKTGNGVDKLFLDQLTEMVDDICEIIGGEDIHIGLTGGATASAIIRHLDIKKMSVIKELSPGIVILSTDFPVKRLLTIKPGSYNWPDSFYDLLQEEF